METMTNKEFHRLMQNHIWYVYTDGKIGKNWRLPENHPHEQLPCFTTEQAFVCGMIIGQLESRKDAGDFVTIYTRTKRIEQISIIIINAIKDLHNEQKTTKH